MKARPVGNGCTLVAVSRADLGSLAAVLAHAYWIVNVRGERIGSVEKARAARGVIHPWKAYRGTGAERSFISAHYDENELLSKGGSAPAEMRDGLVGAIRAVKAEAGLLLRDIPTPRRVGVIPRSALRAFNNRHED